MNKIIENQDKLIFINFLNNLILLFNNKFLQKMEICLSHKLTNNISNKL